MNERIRELVRQAGLDDADFPIENWDNVPLAKFAELIIKECIGVVENLSPGYKDYRDQIEDAFRRDCVEEMKQHFDFEEKL